MVQVIMKPEIFKYATCKEFAEGFALGAEDLVLTNKFIFEPYFGPLGLKVHTIFQEEYGMGEPTDVMCESIMQDAAKTGCKRIIAIGGRWYGYRHRQGSGSCYRRCFYGQPVQCDASPNP